MPDGYGDAREYHVGRYLRDMMISPQLILCFIAEKLLPKILSRWMMTVARSPDV
jgi:hypothetical protein